MERTFAIVKPDAVEKNAVGSILSMAEKAGFKVAALKMLHLSKDEAKKFYSVHAERPFFDSLTNYMSSGPVAAAVLTGDNAVKKWRDLMGTTNPADSPEGTVRKAFGTDIEKNAVHGSDSEESVNTEIPCFFSEFEIF